MDTLNWKITLRKNGNDFSNLDGQSKIDEPIRLVKIAFAYASGIATLSTAGGKEV